MDTVSGKERDIMRKGYVIQRPGMKVPSKFVHMVHDSEAGGKWGM